MSEGDASFVDFLRRLRAGDQQAAAELVRRYERVIRREARLRLTDPRLGRLVDSMDICQSVLASFFVRAAAGQYDLGQPEDLVRLLVRMARNKVASQARRQRARAADRRRAETGALETTLTGGPDPGRLVAESDLLAEVRRRLSAEERQVADLRGQGSSWPEVAAALGGTPEGRRMQLGRALNRVAQELGLAEDGDEPL
jgi:RNA polymerase sigma-70 factor (ECF subfamily)